MSEWVDYKCRIPAIDDEYLVYLPDENHIRIATYDDALGGWIEYDNDEISHWQDLPNSPEF